MRKLKFISFGLCALMLVSCQTLKQQGAAIGAGGGAVDARLGERAVEPSGRGQLPRRGRQPDVARSA